MIDQPEHAPPDASCSLPPYEILADGPGYREAVNALYDEVFGPGRFAKTAERLREGNSPIASASFVAVDALGLTGVVRVWPVAVGATQGPQRLAAFLGPLAVAERRRGNGVAFRLMERAIAECAAAGYSAVILVGDEAYYRRAGFACAEQGRFTLPGPVDAAMVLVRELASDAGSLTGALSVPRAAKPSS